MAAEFERLAYETALRGLDKQEELLRELRSRTGVLLAAASLAASFLKAPRLHPRRHLASADPRRAAATDPASSPLKLGWARAAQPRESRSEPLPS